MKIAILSMYSGLVDRGVESWTREIATRLSNSNEVLVIQGGNESNPKYSSISLDIIINWKLRSGESFFSQVFVWPYWLGLNFVFTLKSIKYLIKFKPDFVFPSNGNLQTLLIKLYSLFARRKMIITAHAGIGAPDKWNLLMQPDYFISPSKRGKKWSESLWYGKKVKKAYIPHGVDLDMFNPSGNKIKLDLEKPVILCVSSLDPFKRVGLALKAISRLESGSLLLIGGDRENGSFYKEAISLLGVNRFKMLRVPPGEMNKYYRSCDVFTLPSTSTEAFGIVYLEALASGLPVVATNDELRREIVADAGILIDPENTTEYSKALEEAALRDWRRLPRKQAEKFDWDTIAMKYEKLFKELVV